MHYNGMNILAYDIEVFKNYLYAAFFDGEKGWTCFEMFEDKGDLTDLATFLVDDSLVLSGFNNFGYDDVMMKTVVNAKGRINNKELYEISKRIIENGRNDKGIFKTQYAKYPWGYSIDIFQLVNKRGSLKEWECKEQMPQVVESPRDFTKPLEKADLPEVREYCHVDVKSTFRLLKKNMHLIQVREDLIKRYDLSDRCYVVGEAGLAQMVFMELHKNRTGEWINATREAAKLNPDNTEREWSMRSIISERIKYETEEYREFLNILLETEITGDKLGRKWKLDKRYSKAFTLGGTPFKLGVGGLHSVDKHGIFKSDLTDAIIDLDVTSYYPSLIIEENLYPKQLGPRFVDDIRDLRDTRVLAKEAQKKAKKKGDKEAEKEAKRTNEALKVVINSTFGKLNDIYSPIRSVPDALRVTVNGQLELLMLIEQLQLDGATILSANTDGVTIKWSRARIAKDLGWIMKEWEQKTGHQLEQAEFKIYARRDVNAYIAANTDGEVKRKGAFMSHPLTGKWHEIIVKQAAQKYIVDGIDPAVTIKDKKARFPDFIYYQRVKNGGHIYYGDDRVGAIARWYIAKNGKQIRRRNPDGSFDRIPCGDHAKLAMDIRGWDVFGIPSDLDFDYYIERTWSLINSAIKGKKNAASRKASNVDDDFEEDKREEEE